MAALPKGIRIRALTQSLNDREFRKFYKYVLEDCGRDFVLKAFFNAFVASHTTEDHQDLDKLVQRLHDIMNSRDDDAKSNEEKESAFEKIPCAVFGHISSFLNQAEHSSFCKASRRAYLGSHSPNSLHTIDISLKSSKHSFNLRLFPKIRHMITGIGKCHKIEDDESDQYMCQHLNQLTLDGSDIRHGQFAKASTAFLSRFCTPSSCIDMKKINKLRIQYCHGDKNDDRSFAMFLMRLSKSCSNITTLSLDNLTVTGNPDQNILGKISMAKLETYEAIRCPESINVRIIKKHANQLKNLTVTTTHFQNKVHTKFPKLENLKQTVCSAQSVNSILEHSQTLKSVHLTLLLGMKSERMNLYYSIWKLFVSQRDLTNVTIRDIEYYKMADVFNGVHIGLNGMGYKETLDVRLQFGGASKYRGGAGELGLRVSNVVKALRDNVDDWKLAISFSGDYMEESDRLEWQQEIEILSHSNLGVKVHFIDPENNYTTIKGPIPARK